MAEKRLSGVVPHIDLAGTDMSETSQPEFIYNNIRNNTTNPHIDSNQDKNQGRRRGR
ncbi:hypothetical protein ABIB50_003255 [Mucilaginibacter sp. UYCu711]